MKVLVVDDNQNIIDAVTLCINLRWPTANVVVAYDGSSGLQMVETERPDIVVLDIGLPDRDGFDVVKQVRQFSHVPIIMLTVRDSDTDIARALQMGADDYITKPFSHLEFLARVEAVLRRATGRGSDEEGPLVCGDLWVDFGRAEVLMGGQPVQLTPMELRLLSHLVHNAGRVIPHQALSAAIWGIDSSARIDSQAIKVHVQNLRRKLGDNATNPGYIGNVYGIGYKFLKQVAAASRKTIRSDGEDATSAQSPRVPPKESAGSR